MAANTVRLSWGSGVGKIVAWLGMRIFWNGARLLSNRAKYGPIPVFLGDSAVNRHVGVVNLPYWWTQNELPLVLPPDADATDICYCLPEEGGGDIMGLDDNLQRRVLVERHTARTRNRGRDPFLQNGDRLRA